MIGQVASQAWNSWEMFARFVAPHFQGHASHQVRAAAAAAELNAG